MSYSFKLAHCTSLLSVLLAVPALSEDYIIDTDVTETNGGYILDGHDGITVTEVGSVTTIKEREYGLEASGDSITLTNNGAIQTSGMNANGLSSQGNNNTLTNSGTVTTRGEGSEAGERYAAHGLLSEGRNNTLTNSGTIETSGDYAHSLFARGSNNSLTNSGTIKANNGEIGISLFARGDNNTVSNSGNVTTSTEEGFGLGARGENNIITNSGTIKTSGRAGFGLWDRNDSYSERTNNILINSGRIETKGNDATGISAGWSGVAENNGTIETKGRFAHGIDISSDGVAENGGTIETKGEEASGIALYGNGFVENSGTIETYGKDAAGIGFGEGGTFTNEASGAVKAARSAAIAGFLPYFGYAEFSQTVINAGLLEGKETAVDLGDGDDTLILRSTSVIRGGLDGGRGKDDLVLYSPDQYLLDWVEGFESLQVLDFGTNAFAEIPGSFETIDIEEPRGRIATGIALSDNTLSIASVSPANLDASVDVGLGNSYLFLDTLSGRSRRPSLEAVNGASSPLQDQVDAMSRSTAAPGGADAFAFTGRGLWADILGRRGSREDDDGVAGNDYSLGGVALGMDGRLPDRDMRLGWGFAYYQGDYDINDGGGNGDTENFMLGAYLGLDHGRYFADFALAAGYNRYDNRRRVAVNGGQKTAKGDFDGYSLAARAAGGANWDYEGVRLQALGALDWVLLDQDGYQESGAGAANLQVDDTTARALRLAAELGAAHDLSVSGGVLTPELRLGVLREIALDDRAVDASLPGFGPAFPIRGNSDDETRGLVRVALTFWDRTSLSASLAYQGEFGASSTNQTLAAGVRYSF